MGKRQRLDTGTGVEAEKKVAQSLIRGYRARRDDDLRNEIYALMRTKVVGYIKGVLSRWRRYEDETAILSLSWDAFLFCLDRYDDEKYDVFGHFNTYTRYFLLLYYSNLDKLDKEEYLEDVKDVISFKTSDPTDALDKMLELKRFRNSLVQDHQQRIFDHLITGDYPEIFANLKKDRGGTSCYIYYKSFGIKEAFKKIIDFILEREKGDSEKS